MAGGMTCGGLGIYPAGSLILGLSVPHETGTTKIHDQEDLRSIQEDTQSYQLPKLPETMALLSCGITSGTEA